MASNYTYKYIIDEYGQIVYPRTVLSAVDVVTANGIQINGDTISVAFATPAQIRSGAQGAVISADGLKEAIAAYSDTLYVAGGGIAIEGGTVFAKPAPVASLIKGTPNETDSVTNENLNGALGVGRALNVTGIPVDNTGGTVTRYTEVVTQNGESTIEDCIRIVKNSAAQSSFYYFFTSASVGWVTGKKYLYIGDFKNVGAACIIRHTPHAGAYVTIPGLDTQRTFAANDNTWRRLGAVQEVAGNGNNGGIFIPSAASTNIDIRIKHFLVFDVTGLTTDAIKALALAEHPELYDKYLVKNDAVCPWMQIHDLGTQTSVSLEAGRAYKLTANDGNTHTIAVNAIPENSYGKETHITILVGATSNVAFKKPLSLMDPLIANAANNCVIKYRDGKAYLYVDDRDYGYVVTIASGGNVDGTMYYGLRTATDNYILISPALDGTPVNLESATGRAVSVVGNGVNKTILTGNVAPTTTTDIHNATFRNVTVTGGQLVLNSDTKVESGSTVGVSGGSVAIKGAIIEPGATVRGVSTITDAVVDGTLVQSAEVYVTNGSISGSGVVNLNGTRLCCNNGTLTINGGTFTNGGMYGPVFALNGGIINISNSLVKGNSAPYDAGIHARSGGKCYVFGCTVTGNSTTNSDGTALCTHLRDALIEAKECLITSNYAKSYGIVHAASQSFIDISDSLIAHNQAVQSGGAFAIGYASGKIRATNCLVIDNTAPSGGAGLYMANVTGATATLSGCTFGNNQDIKLDGASNLLYLNGHNKFNAGINSSGSVSIASSAIVDISDSSSSITGAPITIGDNVTLLTKRGRGRCNSCTCSVIDTSGGVTLSSCTGTTVTTGRNIVVNASKVWVGENISLNKGYAAAGGCFNVSGNAKVILTGTTISGCTATTTGGGVFYFGGAGSAEISNSLITGNRLPDSGSIYGAIVLTSGSSVNVSISDSTISSNYGKQIIRAMAGSTASITNTEITGNTSNGEVGSAAYTTGTGVITITNCHIHNNCEINTHPYSGVFYCSSGGRIIVVDTVITGNTATLGGTLCGVNGGTQSFENCVLYGDIWNVNGSGSSIIFKGNNKFTGKTIHTYAGYSAFTFTVEANAVIDLSNNSNDTPIVAQTINATGTFTIINRYGERHEYSARSVTGSTITNLGVWLPNPGRQSLTGTTDFIGYTLENITYNDTYGAAITTSGAGTKNLRNLTITGCSTTQYGAAVFVQTSGNTVNITDCTISYNLCSYGTIMASGNGSKTVVTHCKIFNNKCSGYGPAGQSWSGGNLTFIDCEIYGNSCGSGGTIMINNGLYLEARGCYFHDNIGSFPGVLAQGATTSISGCTFGQGQNITAQGASTIIKLSGTNILQEIGAAGSVIQITTGAIIDLRGNNVATPIRGATITALGAFTVIDKNGSFHSYTATTKSNSKITNLGIWS